MKKCDSFEQYVDRHPQWQSALGLLRQEILNSRLQETIKWGAPVYTLQKQNVVGIAGFKNYVGLWFYQGVFLTDKHKLLINAQEGKTKGLRQIRYRSLEEINVAIVREYIKEAIENEKAGKRISISRDQPLEIDPTLKKVFEENPDVFKAFEALTKGKQKEFAEHVISAKRESTKLSRIDKIVPMIISGVGLNDKYRK